MKNLRIGILAACLLFWVGASPAHTMMMGMVRPALVGGINEMTNSGGRLGYTGGLDIDLGLGIMVDLMVGAEYLSRSFSAISNQSYIHIPGILFLRTPSMISFGAGGFYDAALSSSATVNYGITGALRIQLGITPLYLEGRYNYGLDTDNWGLHTSEFQGFVGLHF